MKKCPFCAEEIQDAAIVCRFCNRSLAGGIHVPPPIGATARTRAWTPGVAAVLSLVIPGAGQMYKGNVGAGILWLICVVLGYFLFIVPGLILHFICIISAAAGDPFVDYSAPVQTLASLPPRDQATPVPAPAPTPLTQDVWARIFVVLGVLTALGTFVAFYPTDVGTAKRSSSPTTDRSTPFKPTLSAGVPHLRLLRSATGWRVENLDSREWHRCVAEIGLSKAEITSSLRIGGSADVERRQFAPALPRNATDVSPSIMCESEANSGFVPAIVGRVNR